MSNMKCSACGSEDTWGCVRFLINKTLRFLHCCSCGEIFCIPDKKPIKNDKE